MNNFKTAIDNWVALSNDSATVTGALVKTLADLGKIAENLSKLLGLLKYCLLYTSDAADE